MSFARQIWCQTPILPRFSLPPSERPSISTNVSVSGSKHSSLPSIKSPELRPVPPLQFLSNNSTATLQQQEPFLASVSQSSSLACVDVPEQTRITLARLVKGVYELEYRRLQGIPFEKTPPARLYWEGIDFGADEEFHQLKPEKNIDLVVYKWKKNDNSSPSGHRIVIAIRGTLPSMEDGMHNFQGSLQRLHLTPRYREILTVVKNVVEKYGSEEVCIAGHSLGAALGLLVARTLATGEGVRLECHLFNPIYAYSWMPSSEELLENDVVWRAWRAVRCATVAGLANLLVEEESREKISKEYALLRDWSPHLYINTGDPICRGYWEYFTNHERLARSGALGAYIASLAAPFSGRGLLTTRLGSKPSHLIPSVVLHVCEGQPPPIWPGTDLVIDRSRYSNHNLARWLMEGMPLHSREVRLFDW